MNFYKQKLISLRLKLKIEQEEKEKLKSYKGNTELEFQTLQNESNILKEVIIEQVSLCKFFKITTCTITY